MNIEGLTKVELHTVIRCIRACKADMVERRELLEVRHATHGNGLTLAAMLAIENELFIVESALQKLWKTYGEHI